MNRSPDRTTGRDLLFSAYLGLAALLPRLYVAIAWAREPVWDGHYYDFGARRIAAGFGYSDGMGGWHPWCHWPVGYSGFLAAAYRIFGSGPHVATIVHAVTGALLAVFTHRLARYELSPVRARVAGTLCAASPGLVVYASLVMTETLSALAIVVAGWLWMRHRKSAPRRGAALFGVVIGLGTLVHPSFLAYAPALLVIEPLALRFWGDSATSPSKPSWSEKRDRLARAFHALRKNAGLAAIATTCAFVPVLPWTLRNCRVMDRCTLVSTNGGWNLAIGSFSRATGRFETLRSSDGCAVVTGQVQQDACWRDLALHTIKSDFGRWVALIPKKLGFTFDHESFPIEYLHQADPDRWPEDRRQTGRGFLTGTHRLLLTLAAIGVLPGWSRERDKRLLFVAGCVPIAVLAAVAWLSDASPFYLVALATAVVGWMFPRASGPVTRWALFCLSATLITHAVFFGEDRYHMVVIPMLCLLAARAFGRSTEDTDNAPHPSAIQQAPS